MYRSLHRVATGATPRLHLRFCTTSLSNNDADKIPNSSTNEEATRHQQRTQPLFEYDELEARVLQASLAHVSRLGWSESAIIAGAEDVGVSPTIVRSFPRKGPALVEYFMDDCLQKLYNKIESREGLIDLTPIERIPKLIKMRLEMQAPFSRWPDRRWAQALEIQAQPVNVPTSLKQRAMLIDEIWHAAGVDSSDINWCAKHTVLGAVYATTEMHMMFDSSPDFQKTWVFLDRRGEHAVNMRNFQMLQILGTAGSKGFGKKLQKYIGLIMKG